MLTDEQIRHETEEREHWSRFTPHEAYYTLQMEDYGGDNYHAAPMQSVDITRSEYIQLKIRLAELRGVAHDLNEESEKDTAA